MVTGLFAVFLDWNLFVTGLLIKMDHLVEQQNLAPYVNVLPNCMQCIHVQIEDKVISLSNEFWDQMCIRSTAHCTIEITYEEDGMEFMVGNHTL